jgi:murein L,D-transpeptidase YafK
MGIIYYNNSKLPNFNRLFCISVKYPNNTNMKKYYFLPFLITLMSFSAIPVDFFESQLRFPRVKEALKSKGKVVDDLLSSKGISPKAYDIFFRVFKKEQKFEVWVKNKQDTNYLLLKTYDFCASTGTLGPKRRSGDRQTPEGFYIINAFNPVSNYYLSFRVGYPNASDLKFADPVNPGDNIYVHGSCITIGCIPVGDENIKELYLMAAKAKGTQSDISIHIFPMKMTEENYAALKNEYANNASLIEFWSWLKPGYDFFEKTKTLPIVSIDNDGKYIIQ